MKTRIFSIGFLLALLLVFVPSGAEAAQISTQASVLQVEDIERARPEKAIPFEIFLLDERAHFLPTAQATVYVWAEQEQDGRFFRSSALANADGNHVRTIQVRNGNYEGELAFLRAGTYKLYASLEYPGASDRPIAFRTEYPEGDRLIISEGQASVDRISVAYQGIQENGLEDGDSASQALVLHPGGAGVNVTAILFDRDGRRLGSGVQVSASTNSASLSVSPQVAVTDASGQVTFRVYGQVMGDFTLYIDVANRANAVPVTVQTQSVTMEIGSRTMNVDGELVVMDVAPMIINDRTYVPYRALGEAFGAQVEWYAPLSQVQVFQGKDLVTMLNGSKVYQVNGRVATMDVAPFIHNGRMMVPVRFVAEALGYEVDVTYRPQGGTDKVLFTQ